MYSKRLVNQTVKRTFVFRFGTSIFGPSFGLFLRMLFFHPFVVFTFTVSVVWFGPIIKDFVKYNELKWLWQWITRFYSSVGYLIRISDASIWTVLQIEPTNNPLIYCVCESCWRHVDRLPYRSIALKTWICPCGYGDFGSSVHRM